MRGDGGVASAFDRAERTDRGEDRLRNAVKLERELGDDAERSFGADQEAGEVVAACRFPRPAAGLDELPSASTASRPSTCRAWCRSAPRWCPRRGSPPCRQGSHRRRDRWGRRGLRRASARLALCASRRARPRSRDRSACTARMRFMRERSSEMPPKGALTWPSSEVPVPKGMTGTRASAQSLTTSTTSASSRRKTTASGGSRLIQVSVLACCSRSAWLRSRSDCRSAPQVGEQGLFRLRRGPIEGFCHECAHGGTLPPLRFTES